MGQASSETIDEQRVLMAEMERNLKEQVDRTEAQEALIREQEERLSALQQRQQRKRGKILWLVLGILLGCVALYGTMPYLLATSPRSPQNDLRTVLLILAAFIAFGGASLVYLQPTTTRRQPQPGGESLRRMREYLDRRFDELNGASEQHASEPMRDIASYNENSVSIEQVFSSINGRLTTEVRDQAKRGALNLILGIVTTLMGLAVLGFSVLYAPEAPTTQGILAYFVPRVSLAVLIEVLAYFFLRLYKQSLSEIKYFQNEITNVDSRNLAVIIAEKSGDDTLKARIVDELMKTERNFLMSKDQTTVEIEQEKLSRSTYTELIAAIRDLPKRSS